MTDTNPADSKPSTPVKDTLHAPVVYFDGAANFGCNQGIVNVTLAMGRHLANAASGVDFDVIAVAYLRCSITAATDLRKALDKALLLGAPVAGGGQAN
jgi:hypothetical protein